MVVATKGVCCRGSNVAQNWK